MKKDIEYAKLSGVSIPPHLLAARNEARTRLSTAKEKKTDLATRMETLPSVIKEFVKQEATALVDGSNSGEIAMKRGEIEQDLAGAEEILQELETIEKQAAAELDEATGAIDDFIDDALIKGRSEMKQQLDTVISERGRQIGGMRPGEIIRSTPPKKGSKSRIAVCECCQTDIAITNKDIRQPVSDASFEKLPRFDHLPFIPGQQLKYFKCPSCNQTPWGEGDKILTNTGYRIIPETKEKKNVR